MTMKYSKRGLATTGREEGLRLIPYKDSGGVWTDGYGNTHGVIPNGPAITNEKAEADLMANVQTSENAVNRLVKVKLTQGEFDALVDFVFNVGVANFASSTLLKLINAGNFADAAIEFLKWKYCHGIVLAGLLRRRQDEVIEFKEGWDGTNQDDFIVS